MGLEYSGVTSRAGRNRLPVEEQASTFRNRFLALLILIRD